MITIRNGLPIVEGPMFTTFILPPLSFSSTPKYSTILSQRAILKSEPSRKPKNLSGLVTCACIATAIASNPRMRFITDRTSLNQKVMISRYTGSVRAPAKEYRELLKPCGKPIEKLALAARRTILDEAPEANEFIYELYTIAAHFSFTDRPSDAFVFTTTHAKWINLGFNFGAALPDPLRLLEGEGKWIRHVRI